MATPHANTPGTPPRPSLAAMIALPYCPGQQGRTTRRDEQVRSGVARFSGARLDAARTARGFKWDALAARLDVDRALLLHWAAGRRKPPGHRLAALAAVLEVDEEELLDPPVENPTLTDLRADRRLSQKELASLAGIPRSTYAALEAGQLATPVDQTVLHALANALERDVATVRQALPPSATRAPRPTVTQLRHAALTPRLPASQATEPVDPDYLHRRFTQFVDHAGVRADLTLDAEDYQSRTGRPADPHRAGEAFTGPDSARWDRALVYLNPPLLPDRAEADRVLAHEVMHLRWPSYGHRETAFRRAQDLLDGVGAPPTGS